MKKPSLVLFVFFALFWVCSLPGFPSGEAGYWKMEGEPTITFGPGGGSREWMGQGMKIEIVDYDSRHVTIRESGMVGGGANTMTFRSDWSPPAQVIPGEVVDVTVTSTVTQASYERPQFANNLEVPGCQWNGFGGPAMLIPNEDIPATSSGISRTVTNTVNRAKAPPEGAVGGNATLQIQFPCRYTYGFQVNIPYRWLTGPPASPPATAGAATPVTNPAPDGSIIKFSGSTSYRLSPTVTISLPQLRCENPAGWTTGTLKLTLWATQQGPFQGGAVTGFRLAEAYLGTLQGGYHWQPQQIEMGNLASPPSGRYNILFTIEELTVRGYVLENWVNYPLTQDF